MCMILWGILIAWKIFMEFSLILLLIVALYMLLHCRLITSNWRWGGLSLIIQLNSLWNVNIFLLVLRVKMFLEFYFEFSKYIHFKFVWGWTRYLKNFFYCCVGWEYVVAFTKVFIIYQIYHSSIHPFHHSPLSPLPHSWSSFNRSHFFIYIHVYTIFAPYSPFYTLSLRYQPLIQDLLSP
jgi:hypothetical protein